MKYDLFISYSRKDIDEVLKIKEEIESASGIKCWMDIHGIESGAIQFTKDIIDGINGCQVFLFMLSEHSQVSEFAVKELNFAYKKKKECNKKVVIVNIDGCKMSDEFCFMYGLTDTIEWYNNVQKDKLLRDIGRWCKTEQSIEISDEDLFYEAERLYNAKELEKALQTYKKVSGSKKSEAHFRIGSIYYDDNSPFINYAYAKNYFNVSSEEGNKDAMYYLGLMYEYGHGMEKSRVRAIEWFQKAANLGSKEAQNKLKVIGRLHRSHSGIVMLDNGISVYKDCYVDKDGNCAIDSDYSLWDEFRDGLASVHNEDGLYGYIDLDGKIAIPCQWKFARGFSEGFAVIQFDSKNWGVIDKKGKVIFRWQGHFKSDFKNGALLIMNTDHKYGFVDSNGNTISDFRWDDARSFCNDLAPVKDVNGLWGYIDKHGQVIIPCQWFNCQSFREGFAPVQNHQGKWGYIDTKGEIAVPYKYSFANPYSDGEAAVANEYGEWGYIALYGMKMTDYKWHNAFDFNGGIARVESIVNGKACYNYIDRYGYVRIGGDREYAEDFEDGFAWVKDDGKLRLIDRTGAYI